MNDIKELLLDIIIQGGLLSILVQEVGTRFKNNLSGTFHVHAFIVVVLSLTAVVDY